MSIRDALSDWLFSDDGAVRVMQPVIIFPRIRVGESIITSGPDSTCLIALQRNHSPADTIASTALPHYVFPIYFDGRTRVSTDIRLIISIE